MKKIILSITALLIFSFSQAQTGAGTFFIGGGLGFSTSGGNFERKNGNTTTTADLPKETSFIISPGVGYFIADKLAVGLDFNFRTDKDVVKSGNNTFTTTANSIGVSPFARYYMMVTDNFGFTGTFAVGFNSQTSKVKFEGGSTSSTTDGPKTNNISVGISPGIVFFPTEKIGIESNFGFLGYNSSRIEEIDGNITETTTSNSFGLNVSTFTPAFQLGFRYYFAR